MKLQSIVGIVKKYKTAIICLLIACVVVIPILVTTIQASSYPLVFSIGSSSVKPILQDFANAYQKKVNNKFDLIVDGGGSATGIESIALGYTEMGNTSRQPKQDEAGANGKYYSKWRSEKLKTITLAWDGIAIIYKPKNNIDNNLVINHSNINTLYEAMTGLYQGEDKKLNDITPGAGDVKIVAYPRDGGSAKSGTADAFANDSHLAPSINDDVKKALKNGKYNLNRDIRTTAESNAETWLRVSSDNQVGALTYLSTGFVIKNIDDIISKGFKIALYENMDDSTSYQMDYDNIANGYNWVRPINTIVSLKNKKQSVIDFIQWLFYSQCIIAHNEFYDDETRYIDDKRLLSNEDFKNIGIKPLSINSIQSMCLTTNNNTNNEPSWDVFWQDDYIISSDGSRFGAELDNE